MVFIKRAEKRLEKDQRRIGRLFDDISPTYDQLNHVLSMSADVGWRKRTLKELALRQDDVVLDIATGTGDLAIAARLASGCTVIGLDLSRGMMSEAMDKWEKAFDDRYQAVQGDALVMPFANGRMDRAMVAFGIRNMPDIGAFLDETRRVLRDEGRLAVLELSVPKNRLFRPVYLFYLSRVLPAIGGWRSGQREAYRYLSDSIQNLPTPRALEAMYEMHGFRVVRSIPLTMGICHLYLLEKQRP
jgi:demethylmenaquinone methyltransferase/2-methoxy-6-polyprenyl-1,4-benzoquinol methylase